MNNIKESLAKLRKVVDEIDTELLAVLRKRQDAVKEIGELKKKNNMPILDSKRWQKVLESRILIGKKYGLPEELVRNIYEAIHKHSLEIEK